MDLKFERINSIGKCYRDERNVQTIRNMYLHSTFIFMNKRIVEKLLRLS